MAVFEPALLPEAEKERLVRELLDEFELPVSSHAPHRGELIIPCVLGEHKNQHSEPTAAVNYQKLTFKCLGCGRSGGLLWFIAEHRGVDSKDARDWLAKETGTDGQLQDLTSLLRYFDALYADRNVREPIPTYSTKVLEPWMLIHPWVTDPLEMGGRAIPEANVERFKIGYAENFRYSKEVYSERIVLPHFWQGQLVGWQTRRLDANDGTAKYKSSTDFPKDSTIYNYAPEQHSTAIVVESPFSVARHDQTMGHSGPLHFVATFGANITDRQIKLLGRYDRVVYWLDNDPAGWTAYNGLWDGEGKRRVQTKVGVLEETARYTSVWAVDSDLNADPADLDDATVADLEAAAVPWVVWGVPKALYCHRCGATAHEGACG